MQTNRTPRQISQIWSVASQIPAPATPRVTRTTNGRRKACKPVIGRGSGGHLVLVIDLVVSSTLMSMGMMMLPPAFISLPFKILLFVLVDGWNLVTQSLVQSFH